MSNALAVLGPMPTNLALSKVNPGDLAEGIGQAFGVMTYKGKVWRFKFRGQETVMFAADGVNAAPSIDVVIVKASPTIAKIYYTNGFKEDSSGPPDCFSTNGVAPDPASPHKQNATCAACPKNQWGSKINEATGGAVKACSDGKRLAIVSAYDVKSEPTGGPFLLRVPPSSLKELANYQASLSQMGARYDAVVTRVGFDINDAYPKHTYTAVRALTDAEFAEVAIHQEAPITHRMLAEAVDMVKGEIPGEDKPQPAGLSQGAAPPPVAQPQPVVVTPTPPPPVQPQAATAPPAPSPFALAPRPTAANPPSAATGPDPLAVPNFLQRPLPTAAPAQPAMTVVQPSAPVTFAQPETGAQVAETPEQMVARLTAELAAAKAPRTRKPRAQSAPSPAPTPPIVGAPVVPTTVQVAQPVVQQQAHLQHDEAAPTPGLETLTVELDALLEG